MYLTLSVMAVMCLRIEQILMLAEVARIMQRMESVACSSLRVASLFTYLRSL